MDFAVDRFGLSRNLDRCLDVLMFSTHWFVPVIVFLVSPIETS